MAHHLGLHRRRSRVYHSQLLVLARGCNEAAIVVPVKGGYAVREAFQLLELLAAGRVPNDDDVVVGTAGEHVGRRGVPLQVSTLALVPYQRHRGNLQVLREPAFWNVPNHDIAVFRAGGNLLVVEGVPLDVQHNRSVPADLGVV